MDSNSQPLNSIQDKDVVENNKLHFRQEVDGHEKNNVGLMETISEEESKATSQHNGETENKYPGADGERESITEQGKFSQSVTPK